MENHKKTNNKMSANQIQDSGVGYL